MADEMDFSSLIDEGIQWQTDQTKEVLIQQLNSLIATSRSLQGTLESLAYSNDTDPEVRRAAFAQSYSFVQSIRQSLTGEKIEYRFYNMKLSNRVEVWEVNEMQLFQMAGQVIQQSGDFKLRLDKVAANIQGAVCNTRIENKINQHYDDIMNSFEKNHHYVKKEIYSPFGEPAVNPYFVEDEDKKGVYHRKFFSRGHIAEAFDSTLTEVYHNAKTIEDFGKNVQHKRFKDAFFNKHLAYDNIKGFRGGDNGIYQIKANAASIMASGTISKYLGQLEIYLSQMRDGVRTKDIKQLKNNLKDLFTHSDTPRAVKSHVDKQIDEILKVLKS